jgi:hypothetical protein
MVLALGVIGQAKPFVIDNVFPLDDDAASCAKAATGQVSVFDFGKAAGAAWTGRLVI